MDNEPFADAEGPLVTFAPVKREGSHVIISIVSMSGAGKTYTAILLARGLVGPNGRVGMLDTETGRGRHYEKLEGGYYYGELTPPFTPERYIAGIKCAQDQGVECLIIDSGSHEWEGIGGIIEIADGGTTSTGKSLSGLAKWAKPKARHKKFVNALLTTRMHLIICLRAKEKLVQRTGDKGKEEIVSEGFVPIQDKNLIYETTVQLFLPNDGPKGVARLDKCPGDLLGAFPEGQPITVETGRLIAEWVKGGEPVNTALQDLKAEAEESADGGREVFGKFWKRINPAQRRALQPYLPNLQSKCDTAEEEARRAAEEEREGAPLSFEKRGAA